MKVIKFNSALPFQYNFAGRFTAPGSEWMHLTRQLFDFELFVVTEGVLYIAENEVEYAVKKGEYLLMPPTQKQHGYRTGDCSFYWLHFYPSSAFELLEVENAGAAQDATSLIVPVYGELQSFERMVVLMKQLQDSERRYGMRSLNNFSTSVILAELSAQASIYRKYDNSDNSSQLYNDIADYIRLNVCSNLKVADVADYFGYNEKYLTTYFKKWSKVSIKQFILQTKMESAKAQLSETNHSISQIGYNIGYSDPHNFTNAFKKVTGLTPSDYRDSYTKRRANNE
ncbi:MAG: helix-turn-helix transcriptional regulator [Lachnospiraceae bacterium]|nr:helix-turn-helix transcriptional regulator [Lachnospiraceae bacterium]